jgi:hypothetical protein
MRRMALCVGVWIIEVEYVEGGRVLEVGLCIGEERRLPARWASYLYALGRLGCVIDSRSFQMMYR